MKSNSSSSKNFRTTIEITETHLKCVQLKWLKGRHVVTSCDIKAFLQHSDEEIVKYLREVCRSKKVEPSELMVVVSRQWVILKQIHLPSQNDEEIAKMVPLQLVSRIPFSLEEVVYDYEILQKGMDGYSKVLVFVIHKNVSDRYMKIFNDAGIRFIYLTISSYGLAGWLNYAQDQKIFDPRGGTLLVNIDSTRTELCFCSKRQLIFSRSVHCGARDLNEGRVGEFVKQVALSLQTYQKEAIGEEIKDIVILSVLPQAQTLKAKFETELKVPVHILTGYENIFIQNSINMAELKTRTDTTMAVLLGLMIAPLHKHINLTPQEFHDINQAGVSRQRWIKFALLSVVAVLLGSGILGLRYIQKRNVLNSIGFQIEELKQESRTAQQKMKFMELIKSRLDSRIMFADFMQELMAAMPEEVFVRSLSMTDNRRLAIEGYAQSSSHLNNFQQNLIKSALFKDVNLEFATKRILHDMEVTDFKIIVSLGSASGKSSK